ERAQRQDQSVLALSPALELGALPHEVLLDAVEPPLRAALDEARQLELARRALLTERRIGALRFRPREIALECRHALEVGAFAAKRFSSAACSRSLSPEHAHDARERTAPGSSRRNAQAGFREELRQHERAPLVARSRWRERGSARVLPRAFARAGSRERRRG